MFSRSWGQRSNSGSDGHGNLVNSMTRELLKGVETYTSTYYTVEKRNDHVF